MDTVKAKFFNIKHRYDNFMKVLSKTQKINDGYILGRYIMSPEETEQPQEIIQEIYSQTLWFSYRKNFPALLDSNITTDSGWGCMIRVGQMIWAQMLKKHLGLQYSSSTNLQILKAFADDDDGEIQQIKYENDQIFLPVMTCCPFSIQKIAFVGEQLFKLKPGDWYNPNNILHVLSYLHNAKQIAGTQNLKTVIFNDGEFFKDRILSEMQGVQYKCQHIKTQLTKGQKREALVCPQCQSSGSFGVAVFIVIRLGLDIINQEYFPVLDDLMSLTSFQGLMGGKPKTALYILGRVNKEYLYLDPHYVQEAPNQYNIQNFEQTFYSKTVTALPQQVLDPSMAIGFYLKDEIELEQLWAQMQTIKEKHQDFFFIFLKEMTPEYLIIEQSPKAQVLQFDSDPEIID